MTESLGPQFCGRRLVDDVAQQLFKAGKIDDLCEKADLYSRLTLLEAQFPGASVLVHKQGILPPEFAALWGSPELLQTASQLLGGKIQRHQNIELTPFSNR